MSIACITGTLLRINGTITHCGAMMSLNCQQWGSHQVKGCNIVSVDVAASLPGNVQVEASAWASPHITHFARARIEAISPAEQSTASWH